MTTYDWGINGNLSVYGYLYLYKGVIIISGSNIIIGETAGLNLTTGQDNSGLGHNSLNQLTSGNQNTGIGSGSLQELTTGSGNTSLGYQSLNQTISGISNIGIGQNSGNNLTTGNNNVFIGLFSGTNLGSVSNSISIGTNSIISQDYCCQLGENINSNTFAFLQFRSQQIANENWIGGGITLASIDNSGNIVRSTQSGGAENISSGNPSLLIQTTYLEGSGTYLTATLGNASSDGFVKFIAMSTFGGNFVLNITSGIGPGATPLNSITFTGVGDIAELIWCEYRTSWFIIYTSGNVG